MIPNEPTREQLDYANRPKARPPPGVQVMKIDDISSDEDTFGHLGSKKAAQKA